MSKTEEVCMMSLTRKSVVVVAVAISLIGLVQTEDVRGGDDWAVQDTIDFELIGGPITGHFTIEAAASRTSVISGQGAELLVESAPGSAYLSFDVLGYPVDVPLGETPLGTQSYPMVGVPLPPLGDITIYVDITGTLVASLNMGALTAVLDVSPTSFAWHDWGLKVATMATAEDVYGPDVTGTLELRFEYLVSVGVSVDVPIIGNIPIGEVELTTLVGSPYLHPPINIKLRPASVLVSVDFPSAHEAVLSWQPSQDPQFSLYEIEMAGGGAFPVYRIRDSSVTSIHMKVVPDADCIFSVFVEDTDSLRSPRQTITSRSPADPPPDPVIIYQNETDETSMTLTLRWFYTHIEDFGRYEVVVEGEVKSVIREETHNWSTVGGLKPGSTYEVSIVSFDEWGNQATSDVLTIKMPSTKGSDDTTEGVAEGGSISDTNPFLSIGLGFVGGLVAFLLTALASRYIVGRKKHASGKKEEST